MLKTRSLFRLANKASANLLKSSQSLNKVSQRCLSGVNFNLNEEQIEFRDAARKFVDEVIIPNAGEWDDKNIYPADFHKQAWELGFYSLGIPEKYGGLGKGLVDICLINETISIGCTGFSTTMFGKQVTLIEWQSVIK